MKIDWQARRCETCWCYKDEFVDGWCTRYPEHIKVMKDHYCYEYKQNQAKQIELRDRLELEEKEGSK